ncbi:hypothetical protein BN938_2144 [Mucinivorans hirudinis]|uniref:Uncharacterized protein n=1 Tax=Mucinivorans hirudinis TaxID=1433126 RepID=A0A060R9F8_9BACT|nr:hypothetical protein BN938_2144 [Mucinivorans hirudinis]
MRANDFPTRGVSPIDRPNPKSIAGIDIEFAKPMAANPT